MCARAYPVRLPCVSMASSARASKQSRSRDGPLSMEEKSACAHMIARAVDNRQLVEVIDMAVMAAPPSICKEINSLASMCSGWNQMMQAADVPIMTFESPKRTRSPEGGLSEYLVVKEGPTSSTATTATRTLPGFNDLSGPEFRIPTVPQGPMPKDISSMEAWKDTAFNLPKLANRGLSYGQVLTMAWNDVELLKYLAWLFKTYSSDLSDPKPNKASDFVAFMVACAFPAEKRLEFKQSTRVYVKK